MTETTNTAAQSFFRIAESCRRWLIQWTEDPAVRGQEQAKGDQRPTTMRFQDLFGSDMPWNDPFGSV